MIQPISRVLLLAVIEFETPAIHIAGTHGTYGDMAINLVLSSLTSGLNRYHRLSTTKIRALENDPWPDLTDIDALLVTGSSDYSYLQHTATHCDPWVSTLFDYIRRAYRTRKPLVGICYGHQMLARALGGRTAQNPGGWELAVHKVHLSTEGARLFGVSSLDTYQVHRDAVVEPPSDVKIIGSSNNCGAQIMYEPGTLLSFQGHPEFDRAVCESFMNERVRDGELDESERDEVVSRMGDRHDGAAIGVAICNFLLGL